VKFLNVFNKRTVLSSFQLSQTPAVIDFKISCSCVFSFASNFCNNVSDWKARGASYFQSIVSSLKNLYILALRGATSSSFPVGNFHEISFDDVIVLIQPWYNIFTNGHR